MISLETSELRGQSSLLEDITLKLPKTAEKKGDLIAFGRAFIANVSFYLV
jgi:hypothetical protein